MRQKNSKAFLLVVIICLQFVESFSQTINIKRVYANVENKSVEKGKSIKLVSEMFYNANGDCISHYKTPMERFIVTNKFGEVKIYDPALNTIIIQQNQQFSSQSSTLFFFLNGKQKDMGLSELGYIIKSTKIEGTNVITEWEKKSSQFQNKIAYIKLVLNNNMPLYMDYRGSDQTILRKVFFYSYVLIGKYNFPAITTDIVFNYTNTIKDSVITKTTYSNIKINDAAYEKGFDFKIPANAKKLN